MIATLFPQSSKSAEARDPPPNTVDDATKLKGTTGETPSEDSILKTSMATISPIRRYSGSKIPPPTSTSYFGSPSRMKCEKCGVVKKKSEYTSSLLSGTKRCCKVCEMMTVIEAPRQITCSCCGFKKPLRDYPPMNKGGNDYKNWKCKVCLAKVEMGAELV